MRKTDALRQQEQRDRDRVTVQGIIDRLWDDVTVRDEIVDGRRVVNFYSSDATWKVIDAVAHLQGTTMDALIKDTIARHIKLVAKWQLLKDRRER